MKVYTSLSKMHENEDSISKCIEIFYLPEEKDKNAYVRYYLECTILEAFEAIIKEFPETNKCEYRVRYYGTEQH